MAEDRPYYVLSFDFAKAFDKTLHHSVIDGITALGIHDVALTWFVSYLSDRTFCIRLGDNFFAPIDVTSSVIQGYLSWGQFFMIFLLTRYCE